MINCIIQLIIITIIVTLIWIPKYTTGIIKHKYISSAVFAIYLLIGLYCKSISTLLLLAVLVGLIIYNKYNNDQEIKVSVEEAVIKQKIEKRAKSLDFVDDKHEYKDINENLYIGEIEVVRDFEKEGKTSGDIVKYQLTEFPNVDEITKQIDFLIK